MANRRLAPAAEQPQNFAFSPENAEWAQGQIAKYPEGRQASAVIPLLWRAQEQNGGWLPQKAIEAVADQLGMPHIRVLEVATFYTMFALEPVGRHWIQVCGTVPCHCCGAVELKEMLQARLGPSGHVSADGNFSWLEVECLGACCNAPMVQINQDYYEDLTPESLSRLMDDLAAGRPVTPGPQVDRSASAPLGGPDTLSDPALYDGSRVGAWRKRFEETRKDEGAPDSGAKDEAASSEKRAATDPKPARPVAGRPVESAATDAPAQRAAAHQEPVKADEKVQASDKEHSTAGRAAEPAAPKAIKDLEPAGAEAGAQSSLPRDVPPPQPAASGVEAPAEPAPGADATASSKGRGRSKPATKPERT